MTWRELAHIQYSAARLLAARSDVAQDRPACGRAYYAAYSLVTHRLTPANINYAHGWRNPAHADLPRYVNQIPGLAPARQRAVRRALRRLRQRREDADYRPALTVDRAAARESLRDVAEVFLILGAES